MLKNYFITAWRNLWKNKLFSLINIIGLGLAIPFALLSLIQVQSAFEADGFHPYPDRTYRIITDFKDGAGNTTKYALAPKKISELLKDDYPAIEKATYVLRDFGWELNNRVKTIKVNSIYVEPEFFQLFRFPLASGAAPVEPNSLAITEEKAVAIFGSADVVGKTLSHPDYGDFKISGVLKPFKRNTQFRSDVMVSMATADKFKKDSTGTGLNGYTFVLLKPHTDGVVLNAALSSLDERMNKEEALRSSRDRFHFREQLVTDIAPDFEQLKGNAYVDSITDHVLNFSFAMGLLLLAGFNYINLTLARSLSRAKEVGVRKVAGALRYQLIGQFICEAILVAVLALVLGYMVLLLLEHFSYVNWFAWEVDNRLLLWLGFILFTIFIGALAGIVPARILSRLQPAKVLKGATGPSTLGGLGLRNSLVVIQFVASACFIFIIGTMYSQFKYMATENENFNRKNIYNVSVEGDYRLLRQDIGANKEVERIGFVSTPFGNMPAQAALRKTKQEQDIAASYFAADAGFVNNMQLHFLAGSNLPEFSGDSASSLVVVNEKLLQGLGLGSAKDAIGKTFLLNNQQQVIIHGVLADFCYSNYQFPSQALVLQYNPALFKVLSIQTKHPVDAAIFKSTVNTIWKKYYPHNELAFSDYQKDLYDRYFPGRDMRFMGIFSGAVLVIAVLGLLGIVTYHTEKRVKEVGIRKVMGASAKAIVQELSRSFVKLTLIAAGIALPLGYAICYFLIHMFTYNNGVDLGMMVFSFAAVFSVALITIGIKSVYAAQTNPVKTLRSE